MNIDEMKCNISHLLEDRGLTREYKEQAVRLLLYHLYVAMDIYRYMTYRRRSRRDSGTAKSSRTTTRSQAS